MSRLVAFFECHPKSKKSTNMGAQANKIVIQPKVTIMADKFLNKAVSPNNEHYQEYGLSEKYLEFYLKNHITVTGTNSGKFG